jgi:hypothetical protein
VKINHDSKIAGALKAQDAGLSFEDQLAEAKASGRSVVTAALADGTRVAFTRSDEEVAYLDSIKPPPSPPVRDPLSEIDGLVKRIEALEAAK